jgi:hypothetical protein
MMMRTQPVSTVFDFFKGGKGLEMGISFTDKVNKSTVQGQERSKTVGKSMKLS